MKNLLLLILLLPITTFAQLIVDTIPSNKNVILEEFTGIHCVFCPDGHVIAQSIQNTYPDDVFVLNLHTGGYATPGQGEPDFRITESDSIADISNLAGYPAGTVNRHQFSMTQGGGTAMSRGDWLAAASEILAQPSYINIGMLMQYDSITNVLIIDVELYYTDSTPVDGFGFSALNYLNVALIQDSVLGPQTGGQTYNPGAIVSGPWQPTYSHQHMLRAMPTGQWGEAVTNSPVGPGNFVFRRYVYPVPGDINDILFKLDHIKAVGFVTESMQGEIITGTSVGIFQAPPPPPPPVAIIEVTPVINDGIVYDIYGRVVKDLKKNTIYIKNNKKFIKF